MMAPGEPISAGVDGPVRSGPPACSRLMDSVHGFSSLFNSSWMNATLQAALHLRPVKEKLGRRRPADLRALSRTPRFAKLFLAALRSPELTLGAAELSRVLRALSRDVPSLVAGRENDPLDLLVPCLFWLERCGIPTRIQTVHACRCSGCRPASTRLSLPGRAVLLGPGAPQEASFRMESWTVPRHVVDPALTLVPSCGPAAEPCENCGSAVAADARLFPPAPDVVTFRADPGPPRRPGSVPEEVRLEVDGDAARVYRLSSVICHDGGALTAGRYWTFLRTGGGGGGGPAQLLAHGLMFLYEICPFAGITQDLDRLHLDPPAAPAAQ